MGITYSSLRALLPRGLAWILAGYGDKLVRGIAATLERSRADTDALILESRPGTASAVTLREWHDTLYQQFSATRPIASQRARLEAFLTSAGGATKIKIEAQIQLEYPDITVSEISATSECGVDESGVAYCGGTDSDFSPRYYDVSGTVDYEEDAQRIGEILARFAPYHLFASFESLVIRSLTASSEAGLSICGYEECGNDGL